MLYLMIPEIIRRKQLRNRSKIIFLSSISGKKEEFAVRPNRYTYDFRRVMDLIPECRMLSYSSFAVAATDTSVLLMIEKFGIDYIECEDPIAEMAFAEIFLRKQLSDHTRLTTALFKEDDVVPEHSIESKLDLAPYQQVAAFNAIKSPGYGFFMEQGTGKTPTAIAAMDKLPEGSKILIVAPKNVRTNWVHEIRKFSTRKCRITVIRGGLIDRIKTLVEGLARTNGEELSVIVCSYDSICNTWEAFQAIQWELSILDESHYIKSQRTRRWEYCKQLRDNSSRRLVLTGTPITNSLNDLYTQFEFMGEGYSGFASFPAFRQYFGEYKKTEDGYQALVAVQNIPILKDRLSRYAFQVSKEEALPDLPDKVYDIEEVEMTDDQREAYIKLANQLALEIDIQSSETANPALVVNNILTKLLKLSQITSGFLKFPEERDPDGEVIQKAHEVRFAPNPKIDRLIEILDEKNSQQKTIIWACYTTDIERITKAIQMNFGENSVVQYHGGTKEADRESAAYRFNHDPNCRFFVGNASAGGTGLNLLGYPPGREDEFDTDCDHVIYFSQNWSAVARSQSEDRAHRRGTRNNVRITDLCVPGSIDEEIRVRVHEKRKAAIEFADVRDILKGLLANV